MKRRHFEVLSTALLAVFCSATLSSAVTFNEIARFDIDSTANSANNEYIGSNPSAVGWSGNQLYVAGYNNGGATSVGIVEIENATSTGIVAPTFSAVFGAEAAPSARGYSGLDISADGDSLSAAYDDGGDDPHGFAVWNTADNTNRWFATDRGSSGTSFDPGFNGGGDMGTGYGQFNSGRRVLHNTTTGANIYDTSTGLVWYGGGSTLTRDIDFDPDTGDIYVRHANDVTKATRNGANSTTGAGPIVDVTDAAFIAGQNLAFLSNTVDGDLVAYNDRPSNTAGSIQVADSSGAAQALTMNLIGGGSLAAGNGWYDFDFDPDSQTLAVLDFANRNVHIFSVVPEPATGSVLVLGLLTLLGLRRRA